MSSSNPLPASLTARIIDLSKRIPDSKKRQDFLASATTKIAQCGAKYPNTIFYSVAGMLVGEILDNLLTVPVIDAELTSDLLSHVGAAIGAAKGLQADVQSRQARDEIASIIRSELSAALQ
jgi:hypothetical protein